MSAARSLRPLVLLTGAAVTSSESHASAALQVRRVQQIALGQRPHAVGTQNSVVSPAPFVALGWVGFQRKKARLVGAVGGYDEGPRSRRIAHEFNRLQNGTARLISFANDGFTMRDTNFFIRHLNTLCSKSC